MTTHQSTSETYDRNIIPAETAARIAREGENFKQLPTDDASSLDTTGGYTMSREGLLNNYAVEPEMYYETPGDLRHKTIANQIQRKQELQDVNNTDERGRLSLDGDRRGKGVGMI